MQWFKHYSDARQHPKFRAIEKKLGEAGYARAFKLFEIVAQRGGTAAKFAPVLDLKNPYTNLDWLADELRISGEDTQRTLEMFASVRLIEPKAFKKEIIRIPQMLRYLDEWTGKALRGKKSRTTPDQLQSDSGATPDQSKRKRKEKEAGAGADADADAEKREETAATTAAHLLEKTKEGPRREIDTPPCGSPEFQSGWERVHGDRSDSEKLADAMERYIQACGQAGIPIPPPFFDAKRKVEKREQPAAGYPLHTLFTAYWPRRAFVWGSSARSRWRTWTSRAASCRCVKARGAGSLGIQKQLNPYVWSNCRLGPART